MQQLSLLLGKRSCFAADADTLLHTADLYLKNVDGGGIRYRFAKILDMGSSCSAVLHITPRYENAQMVMDMREIGTLCKAPLFSLGLDGDWDESGRSRLRSFLYYCKKENS